MDSRELRDLRKIVRENNKMLKKIRSVQKREWLWKVFKYALITAIMLGAYYTVQPFIENLDNTYQSLFSTFEGLKGVGDLVN